MVRIQFHALAIFAAFSLCIGCAHRGKLPAAKAPASGKATVLWISVDGLRGDYVSRAKPPFLSKLASQGHFTRQLIPVFPSLTFPSHLSEATGVLPGEHGITGNAFYDSTTHKDYSFPDDASLVQVEPIWITAERQGVRTAVVDWPMSQRQTGDIKSAYFNPSYDTTLSDADRIAKLVQVYQDDHEANPLRLLMGYVHAVDTAGHKFGPDSPLVDDALRETDKVFQHVVTDVQHAFDEKAKPEDELYVLITTDHGMMPLKMFVNLQTLFGDSKPDAARIVTSGSVAQIYLNDVPADARTAACDKMVALLKEHPFLRVWRRAEVPPEFNYNNPTRTGDIIVACRPGYTLTSRLGPPRPPLPADVKGMHGYDPAECPEMCGFAVLWRYRRPLPGGSRELQTVSSLQLHPTVAGWLGIQPSPAATAPKIRMPPK